MAIAEKNSAWDQHFENINSRQYSRNINISIVTIDPPIKDGWPHKRHVHPYWQIAIVYSRSFSIEVEGETFIPKAGDILMIPSQNWHHFDFSKGKKAWSIKFSIEGIEEKFRPSILQRTPETVKLHKWLLDILQPIETMSHFSMTLLEHLLSALVDLYLWDKNIESSEFELIRKIRFYINNVLQQGGVPRVEQIANINKLSSAHITRIFKKQLGIPLKNFIDQQRVSVIRNHLSNADFNISEVAQLTGFDDVFRMSRFFKRNSGISPRQYRQQRFADKKI